MDAIDWQQLGETAARGLLVYVVMLVIIRLLGKRTVGNFTAFDLLVALMLGEVVDEIIYGDVTIAQGMIAILVIAAAKYITAWLACWGHGLEKVLEGVPTEIVKNGQLIPKALRHEMLSEREAIAALRLQGVADIREVKSAVMEVDGVISVIRADWAETLQKGDVLRKEKLKEKERKAGEEDDEEMRTDSPEALGTE